jgi:hypothetical protein
VSGRPGSRREHDRFCQIERWDQVRNARGKTGHHHTYELRLPDGRVLRTRVSHPVNNDTYGPRLWSHILDDQLQVTEAEFWRCVSDKQPPDRGQPDDDPPPNALPVGLVHQLIHTVGLPEAEVAAMSLEDALAVMNDYWSRPGS